MPNSCVFDKVGTSDQNAKCKTHHCRNMRGNQHRIGVPELHRCSYGEPTSSRLKQTYSIATYEPEFEVEVIERNCSADPMELREAAKRTKASQMHLPCARMGPKGSRALHRHELAGKVLSSVEFHKQQSVNTDTISTQRRLAVWGFSALEASQNKVSQA